MREKHLTGCLLAVVALVFVAGASPAEAQPGPARSADARVTEDAWVDQRDEQTGILVRTKELTVYPRGEPSPALRVRLLPDLSDTLPGNAAVYYLKAMGFLEQDPARERLRQVWQEAVVRANESGQEIGQVPPYVWLNTPPEALPTEEVREYLRLMSFQPPFLREAARRSAFDLDRNLPDVDDPIAYLLPEIQRLRELARGQSIRCRLAIAEGRIDDAVEITGQQLALARHLGEDDFLVSNLVGIAIGSIAWNDALYLVQQAESPNLYWALAALPRPLVDMRRSMATERQFVYMQLKVLPEVDETLRPAGYWQDFLDRLVAQLGSLPSVFGLPVDSKNPEAARATLVAFVAAAYPGARDYLIRRQGMPTDQVESYPTAQVVFLAMVRFYDHWRDEFFKWTYLPYWQVRSKLRSDQLERALAADVKQYGWFTFPTEKLLPGILAARTAQARCQQGIALLQCVEAIRMYAAAHQRKLPRSLDDLAVPAPLEPFTGQPIDYELIGDRAVLSGHALPGIRYRLILRVAE